MRRLCAPRAVATPLRDASDARTCDWLLRAAVVHVGTAEAGGGPSPSQVRRTALSKVALPPIKNIQTVAHGMSSCCCLINRRLAQIIAAHGEQRRLQNAGKPRAGAPIAPETGLMGAGGSGTSSIQQHVRLRARPQLVVIGALAPNVAGRPQRCAWPPSTSALPRTGTKSRPKVRSCPPRSAAPQMTGRACTCLLPSRNPVELRNACRA